MKRKNNLDDNDDNDDNNSTKKRKDDETTTKNIDYSTSLLIIQKYNRIVNYYRENSLLKQNSDIYPIISRELNDENVINKTGIQIKRHLNELVKKGELIKEDKILKFNNLNDENLDRNLNDEKLDTNNNKSIKTNNKSIKTNKKNDAYDYTLDEILDIKSILEYREYYNDLKYSDDKEIKTQKKTDNDDYGIWNEIFEMYNKKYEKQGRERTKDGIRKTYTRRGLVNKTFEQVKQLDEPKRNIFLINDKINIAKLTENKNKHGEIDWQHPDAKKLFPNLSSKNLRITNINYTMRNTLDKLNEEDKLKTTTESTNLINSLVRSADKKTKDDIIKLIDQDNIYFKDVAHILNYDSKKLAKLYNNIHNDDNKQTCQYTNCIKIIRTKEEEEKHKLKSHKSKNNQLALQIATTPINNTELSLVNKLKKKYSKLKSFTLYYLFDNNLINHDLEKDKILNFLDADGYFGITNRDGLRQPEHLINSIITKNKNPKDLKIAEMKSPSIIKVENNISYFVATYLETSAINSDFRNLINIKTSSLVNNQPPLTKLEDQTLQNYVIKKTTQKFLNNQIEELDKNKINYITNSSLFTIDDLNLITNEEKMILVQSIAIISKYSSLDKLIKCNYCQNLIKKSDKFCSQCGQQVKQDDNDCITLDSDDDDDDQLKRINQLIENSEKISKDYSDRK